MSGLELINTFRCFQLDFLIKIPKEQSNDEPYKNYNVINKLRDYGRQTHEQDIVNYDACMTFTLGCTFHSMNPNFCLFVLR